MFSASVFFVFVNLTFAASRVLVPSITVDNSDKNDFKLEPTDDGYKLTINRIDGFRDETVKEIAPGELQVKGQYKQNLGNDVYLLVTYEAGRSGYIARYRIYIFRSVTPHFLPAAVLKSNVG
ncbi:uncharacterized protein LOC117784488 [Drosophila innubila]|uniref:uncharacterized protein LOC117784488 n=1 Tax=Drosophila innubila TaxID=198719 RepID=UPI00148B6E71|nr:uncharacterized protein LOC117784488 [Drosophila innubila]